MFAEDAAEISDVGVPVGDIGPKHPVPDELLNRLLANYLKPEDLIGENDILKQLTQMLVERALDAQMTHHLGHGKNEPVANPVDNIEASIFRNCRVKTGLACGWLSANRRFIPMLRHQHRPEAINCSAAAASSGREK